MRASDSRLPVAVAALCLVQFMDVLGVTVVVTALPAMLSSLHAAQSDSTLIATGCAMGGRRRRGGGGSGVVRAYWAAAPGIGSGRAATGVATTMEDTVWPNRRNWSRRASRSGTEAEWILIRKQSSPVMR
jgi:hypothetical protein